VIPAGWGIQNQPTLRFIYMYELPAQAYARALADFERLQSAGKVRHLPVREFRLDQIAQAHEAVEKGNNATRMVIVMT
jgi:NADPH2:quinone reductase